MSPSQSGSWSSDDSTSTDSDSEDALLEAIDHEIESELDGVEEIWHGLEDYFCDSSELTPEQKHSNTRLLEAMDAAVLQKQTIAAKDRHNFGVELVTAALIEQLHLEVSGALACSLACACTHLHLSPCAGSDCSSSTRVRRPQRQCDRQRRGLAGG